RPPSLPLRGRARARAPRPRSPLAAPLQVENSEERFLRHLDRTHLLHSLLPGLLTLAQLALAGDVAAIALGQHVLPLGLDCLARDHPRADRRLDRDVEELSRDLLPQPLDECTAAGV